MAAPEAAMATTPLSSSIAAGQPIVVIRERLARSMIQARIRMQSSKTLARLLMQASYIATGVESGESNNTTHQTKSRSTTEPRAGDREPCG
jgi:hypothetical protein